MNILGLSAFGSDAAAVLLRDGVVVAAVQEEHFTRVLRDASFPRRAVRACLREGGITTADLDWVVFHEKPLRRFERVLASQLRGFPRSAGSFSRSLFLWLGDRLWLKNRIATELGIAPELVLFGGHHESHAASTFFASPFEDAAVLVVDGAGEWATTSLWRGNGSQLQLIDEQHYPHSLGLFYSAMAEHLGFAPGGGESRLMELAAHGKPTLRAEVDRLLHVGRDGSITLDMSRFRFDHDSERLCSDALVEVLGPARIPGAPLRRSPGDSRDADLAASVQAAVEDALLALVAELHRRAPSENLCLAGDLALNAAAVGRIARDGPFRRLFVQPAAGDAGCALGAALHVHHAVLGGNRVWRQEHVFLGESVLAEPGPGSQPLCDDAAVVDALLASLLGDGLVGWVRGRNEWGPRSLGHRSLLADPRRAEAAGLVSRAVKRREDFRPFSPAVPAERAAELFELPGSETATAVAPGAASDMAQNRHGADASWPLRFMQVNVRARAATIAAAPAAVQADGSCRPQLVHAAEDPLFHALLTRFGAATGVPLLLHTSLNLRGEPPVRGEADALALLARSELPALIVEDRLYTRG